MLRVIRTKLYKDYLIDVRSFEAIRCIELKESIEITYNGKKMTLTPQQLRDERIEKGTKVHSIKGTPPYTLWSYMWTPDEPES